MEKLKNVLILHYEIILKGAEKNISCVIVFNYILNINKYNIFVMLCVKLHTGES